MGKQREGHDQGQVVIDHGKDDERRTQTEGGGCTLSRAPKPREVITYRNQITVDGNGGRESINSDENFRMKATRDHSTMNSVHLIKAGCGGDWARLSSKPGSPATLSKFFCRCAATVSCGQYEASRPDSLRTAHQSVVGTERSVASCSILLNDLCMTDANVAQATTSCQNEKTPPCNCVFPLK